MTDDHLHFPSQKIYSLFRFAVTLKFFLPLGNQQGKDFNLGLAIQTRIITNYLRFSLSICKYWGDQIKTYHPVLACHVLNRMVFASTLSQKRRINFPIERDGKLAKPCQLQ